MASFSLISLFTESTFSKFILYVPSAFLFGTSTFIVFSSLLVATKFWSFPLVICMLSIWYIFFEPSNFSFLVTSSIIFSISISYRKNKEKSRSGK